MNEKVLEIVKEVYPDKTNKEYEDIILSQLGTEEEINELLDSTVNPKNKWNRLKHKLEYYKKGYNFRWNSSYSVGNKYAHQTEAIMNEKVLEIVEEVYPDKTKKEHIVVINTLLGSEEDIEEFLLLPVNAPGDQWKYIRHLLEITRTK